MFASVQVTPQSTESARTADMIVAKLPTQVDVLVETGTPIENIEILAKSTLHH